MKKILFLVLLLGVAFTAFAGEAESAEEMTYNGVKGVFIPWDMFRELNMDLAELDVLRETQDELYREIDILTEANEVLKRKLQGQRIGLYVLGATTATALTALITILAIQGSNEKIGDRP